jgi:hypothetical protein
MPKILLEVDVPDTDPAEDDAEILAEQMLYGDGGHVELLSAEWVA